MTAIALTIAGSDSGGGAGIQADLTAFRAFGVFGTSAITAVTAQNTQGITAIHTIPPTILAAQIKAVLDDFDVRAIKIGMIPSADHAMVIAERLAGCGLPVVLDPVISATSGRSLGLPGTIQAVREHLFPLAACITPNLPEAVILLQSQNVLDQDVLGQNVLGQQAAGEEAMIRQAACLLSFGPGAVLLKGGHGREGTGHPDKAVDILVSAHGSTRFASAWVETSNLHGTGCALSAAVAANLAWGHSLEEAVSRAKAWLTARLIAGAGHKIGHGKGPAAAF